MHKPITSGTVVSKPVINRTVLMSDADYFVDTGINSHSNGTEPVVQSRALADVRGISEALARAGVKIEKVPAPPDCPDGIFTANWGLNRGDTVILSSLPPQRQGEQPYAEAALRNLGKRLVKPPYRFSGQGDALPCGDLLFAGSNYRTDPRMHQFLADELGFEVIGVEAVPELAPDGTPVINRISGWPDSFFYDLDLGICVLRPDLIAWYPGAWTEESQDKIRATSVEKIEVTKTEAMNFACNLVSTGSTVVMGKAAPKLKAAIESHGIEVTPVDVVELCKGGGFIRCTTLTLDNQ
jgi:N-dimethylarginine dimethylaminohydrolase